MKSSRFPLALLALSALALAACSTSGGDEGGGARVVSAVEFDGLVVLEAVGPRERSFSLFDPNTGQSSSARVQVELSSSPAGRFVAWFDRQGDGATLFVARPVLVGGAPELEVVHELVLGSSPLTWLDDETLFTTAARIDVESGEVQSCPLAPAPPLQVVPVPGTREHLCPLGTGTLQRYDDGVAADTLQGGGELSPDGQFLGHTLHLATGVRRDDLVDELGDTAGLEQLALPDGRILLVPGGTHGEYVVYGFSGLESTSSRETTDAMPVDGRALDPVANFDSGVLEHDGSRWDLEKALRPWFDVGGGRHYAPLFVRADGESVVYAVTSHVVEARFIGHEVGQEPSVTEVPVDSALVEVFPDGTSRGFLTSSTARQAAVLGASGLEDEGLRFLASRYHVDLGGDDWLVAGFWRDSLGVLEPGLWGYLGGRAVALEGFSATSDLAAVVTQDGRWLVGLGESQAVGEPLPVCLRELGAGPARCIVPQHGGTPVAVVGQGLHEAFVGAAPMVLGLSRVAAPVGDEVEVFGAHFGSGGSVTIGEVEVPAQDVVAWEDHRIRVRVSEALPVHGPVVVTTAQGTSHGRAFHLGRSASASPPLAGVPRGPFELAQGLNLVDLGDLGDPGAHGASVPFAVESGSVSLSPEARQPDGRFAVFSPGGEDEALTTTIRSDAFTRNLDFVLRDRLAGADDGWQMVMVQAVNEDRYPGFVTLAGDLVERSQGVHPTVGTRFSLAALPSRPPINGATGQDIPEYFRTEGGRTFVSLGYQDVQLQYPGWPMRELLGFTDAAGTWGVAQYAPSPQLALPNYHRHFALDGETLLVVGADPNGERGPHYALSQDGGATLGPGVYPPEGVLPSTSAFAEPVTVRAASGTFFLVLEIPLASSEVLGAHAISPSGELTTHVIEAPPSVWLSGYSRAAWSPMLEATDGGRVLLHFASSRTMMLADFDEAQPSWTVLPSAADAGQIRSFYHDEATGEVVAIRVDGSLARATRAGGWRDWAPLELGIDLGVDIELVPMALARLPDGRWVVHARWLEPDAEPSTPSIFGPAGWLLGPR